MNFGEVLKKIPTPQVSMGQFPKLNLNLKPEGIGKPPAQMTQEDMQQLIRSIGETVLIPEDGAFIGLWILTLIDHWNNEHERVVILTERNFYLLRYDFGNSKLRDSRRIGIGQLISVVTGPLVFPAKSLMPVRSSPGVELRWGDDQQVSLTQKWNPMCKSLPYAIVTHHPLITAKPDQLPVGQTSVQGAGYQDPSATGEPNQPAVYDASNFMAALRHLCSSSGASNVEFSTGEILIESYGNLGSVVFNQSNLGFSKTGSSTIGAVSEEIVDKPPRQEPLM